MKLDYKKVLYVGFAFMIIQAFWIAYDAIVPLMLVNKFGMNQTWSGLIMAFDNILAIFLLPVFGSLSDKTKCRMGKRKPYVLIGTLCAALAFFGLSFVDYAQYKNLGEQAEMPSTYQSTEASVTANQYFWDHDYEVPNAEYSKTNDVNNNSLGQSVTIKNYVSHILFNKDYADLTDEQQATAKDWYVGLNLSDSYMFTVKDGVPTYTVYHFEDEDTVSIIRFDGSGAEASNKRDAQAIGSVNVYSSLVTTARSQYAAEMTYENPLTLILFMVVLLITLISMAVFRSPAVALMPDVVIKPLRSKGNAVINLMGVVGIMAVLVMGMIFGTDKVYNQLMPYTAYIGCVCIIMLVCLLIFMIKVKEPKWNAEMLKIQEQLDANECAMQAKAAEDGKCEKGEQKHKLSRSEFISLVLILLSVAFWYMGYNAVSSKYSLYAINVLGKSYNLTLIIAQVVSVIAFIPIGIISSKFGRRKTILAGVTILTAAFFCACFVTRATHDIVLYILFAFAGIAWAAINVNSFPMVVELARGSDIGKYTGYYYTASMAAQIATPTLSGILMDAVGSMAPLFIYGTIFVALSFVTMFFVRHGDSRPEEKEDKLSYLDVNDD